MGYYSTWCLAINARSGSDLANFLKWMKSYSTDQNIDEEKRDIMEYILSCQTYATVTNIEFEDDSVKCYDPWDSVIDDIVYEIDNKDRSILDCAYVRFGEDDDDQDIRNGDNTHINILKSLSDTSYEDLTLLPSLNVFDHQVQDVVSVTPKEEKCHCGRMKDYGQKCWWCGI